MTKIYQNKYDIDEEGIKDHAPVFFDILQDYYARLGAVKDHFGANDLVDKVIEETVEVTKILPNPELVYEDSFLNINEFKMMAIYHLGICNMVGDLVSWEEYLITKEMIVDFFKDPRYENLSSDTLLIKSINADPGSIPKKIMAKISSYDEFNQAVEIIVKELNKVDGFTMKYKNYEDYFDYMKERAQEIDRICQIAGYYGTHDLERFAAVCISQKLGIVQFDTLYKVPHMTRDRYVTTESMKNAQEQLISQIFGR